MSDGDNCYFTDWADILRFLTASPKMLQEIQSVKAKIENLEYNHQYIQLLKNEYQRNDKLLNSNKQSLSENCGILLQVFLSSIDYI